MQSHPALRCSQVVVRHTVQGGGLEEAPVDLHMLNRVLTPVPVQVIIAGGNELDALALGCG